MCTRLASIPCNGVASRSAGTRGWLDVGLCVGYGEVVKLIGGLWEMDVWKLIMWEERRYAFYPWILAL